MTRALLLCVALAACSGGGDDDDSAGADAGSASITLATGADQIEELTDGGMIYIVQGPQGGFHFYGSFYATGIEPGNPDDLSDPDNPTGEFRVFEGSTRVDIAVANEFTQGLEPIPGTGGVGKIGRLVILDISDDSELDGATVRFEVEVTCINGVTVSDQRTLTAVPHPDNL